MNFLLQKKYFLLFSSYGRVKGYLQQKEASDIMKTDDGLEG